jgi:type IV pilus assembly protein PilZ
MREGRRRIVHRNPLDNRRDYALARANSGESRRFLTRSRAAGILRHLSDVERRRHPRAPIELRVEYKRLNSFFADYTKNISKGGTFIKTTKPLDVGTEFRFKLAVPTLPAPIEIRGTVQWVVKEGEEHDDESAGMGISFTYDDRERAALEGTVEKLMKDSLGQHLYERLLGREDGGEDEGEGEDPSA